MLETKQTCRRERQERLEGQCGGKDAKGSSDNAEGLSHTRCGLHEGCKASRHVANSAKDGAERIQSDPANGVTKVLEGVNQSSQLGGSRVEDTGRGRIQVRAVSKCLIDIAHGLIQHRQLSGKSLDDTGVLRTVDAHLLEELRLLNRVHALHGLQQLSEQRHRVSSAKALDFISAHSKSLGVIV